MQGGTPLRVALIGYGNAGRNFHAPVLAGVPGLTLACVCTGRADAVATDWPHARVVQRPEDAFADPSIDLVVVATPNETHHRIAKAALLAGKHVLVDKPCTVTFAETEDLLAVAAARRRVLTVYQNRRYDADFLVLQQVLQEGTLGRITYFESRFDRYKPLVLDRWRDHDVPGAGLWLDLGAHLVDQSLQLFGCPDEVLLDTAMQRDGAEVHDYFHAQLRYQRTAPGLRVVLHATTLAGAPGPRFVLHGTKGSWTKHGSDPQEDALKAGVRPSMPKQGDWGRDTASGELVTYRDGAAVAVEAPQAAGNYMQLYAHLRDHIQGLAPEPPTTPGQIRQLMGLLSRGEQSAREGRFIATADLAGT